MNFELLPVILFSTSILCFTAFAFTILIKKRYIYEKTFLGKKAKNINHYSISKILLRPFIPSNAKINEMKNILEKLELNINHEKIYVISAFSSLFFAGAFYSIIAITLEPKFSPLGLIIGSLFGYHIVTIMLKTIYEQRQKNIQTGILPYVEMLLVSCEAGLTLTLAIERVYEYYPIPVALEFKKANNDFMANIKTRNESFQEIAENIGGSEIKLLVESILQSIEIGTPMKKTLRSLADAIRRDLRADIISKGQQGRWKNFVISIVFQLPPYMFILVGPSLYSLFSNL